MSLDFVRYSPDIETIDPHIDELLPQIIDFWEKKGCESPRTEGTGRAVRGAHAKSIGVVKAEVEILHDVPAAYAQGIYAAPQEDPLAAVRSKNTYLAAQYQRLKPRIGHGRALGAVKHSMLIAYWHVFSTGETYRDLGGDYLQRRDPARATNRLVSKLDALGHTVTLHPTPPEPKRHFSPDPLIFESGIGEVALRRLGRKRVTAVGRVTRLSAIDAHRFAAVLLALLGLGLGQRARPSPSRNLARA
jgi:hypothetical protein